MFVFGSVKFSHKSSFLEYETNHTNMLMLVGFVDGLAWCQRAFGISNSQANDSVSDDSHTGS